MDGYKEGYDHTLAAWNKKQKAATFADFLAPELGIARKGVVVDKDGKYHRVHIPLLAAYWSPAGPDMWENELRLLKAKVKTWASE